MSAKIFLLSLVAAGMALQAAPGVAQTAAGGKLEEIIVTARKREESILKVPVIENVITQKTLEQYQIADLTDLSAKVPGLSMGNAVLSIGPQVSIRGVGTSTLDAGVDQSVALNVDGLSLSQGLAYKSGLFDLAQAEVLKGPQALFFGKNSPGGVISLRTADPGEELELIGRASYEIEAREKRGELIASGPITDTLGVRLAGLVSDSDGFFHNRASAQPGTGGLDPKPDRVSATRSNMLRGTAVWSPTEAFSARLKLNWATDETQGDASQGQVRSCPDGTGSVGTSPLRFFHPNENCKLDREVFFVHLDPAAFRGIRNGGRPFFDLQQKFGTLELNYRPTTEVTLTSVSGYYLADVDTMINGTQSGYAASSLSADNKFRREDFTQEFRLNTDFDGPVNYTLGVFYQNGEIFNRVLVLGNTAFGLPPILTTGSHDVDIESWSVFGQARWRPVQQVELAGGVRYTDEKRKDTPFNLITGTPVFTPIAQPQIASQKYSPELTVTYTPTDDLTLFGSLKRGYKSGSFTITTPVGQGIDNSFGDEKVDGGEIGLKSRLLDRTLAFNVAGYYYIYDGLQVGTNEPAQGGLPIIRTINAGEAEIYGVDLELTYSPPIEGLSLNAAMNWNHARFTKLRDVPCYGGQTIAAGCDSVPNLAGTAASRDPATGLPLFTSQSSLDGLRLVRAPDWQVTAGAAYEMLVGATELTFGLDGQYSSEYPTGLNDRKDAVQKGVGMINANVAVSGNNGAWEVALIGNNLTNEITTGSCTPLNYANAQILGGVRSGGVSSGPSGIDEFTCVTRTGREAWVRLTFRPMGFFK